MQKKKLMIFTDLDGTLLDHHSYDWSPACPALKKLGEKGIPVILCTSKTAAEVSELHREMQLTAPYIVENGSGVIFPENGHWQHQSDHFFGKRYKDILSALHTLRRNTSYRFTGFNDMSVSDVSTATGLSMDQAALARQRICSEPFIWHEDESTFIQFSQELHKKGIQLVRGGRFYHAISAKAGKGVALKWLVSQALRLNPLETYFTVALGDGPNDEDMLNVADLAVVIPSVSGCAPSPQNRKILHATEPGPAGWNQAVLNILQLPL